MNLHSSIALLLLTFFAAACSGCASLAERQATRQPAAPETKESFEGRKYDAVASFERKRDAAQVQAAVNCWERGEIQKSEAMLNAILQRNPRDVIARFRLAEILTSQNEAAAAESQLRECLKLAPDSAELHHALGLLLSEFPGREQEASSFLSRACELEPDNEAYAAVKNAL